MMEEISSILWGLSLAFNIILLLIGLPLCLLICCCCRKHQDVLEQDLRMLAKNHNILQENQNLPLPPPQAHPQQIPQNQNLSQRKIKQSKRVNFSNPEIIENDEIEPDLTLKNYQMEDE